MNHSTPSAKRNTEKCDYCRMLGLQRTLLHICLEHSVLFLCCFTFLGIEEGKKYVEKAVLKYKEIINSVDELCRSLRELKEMKVFFFYLKNVLHLIQLTRLSV